MLLLLGHETQEVVLGRLAELVLDAYIDLVILVKVLSRCTSLSKKAIAIGLRCLVETSQFPGASVTALQSSLTLAYWVAVFTESAWTMSCPRRSCVSF